MRVVGHNPCWSAGALRNQEIGLRTIRKVKDQMSKVSRPLPRAALPLQCLCKWYFQGNAWCTKHTVTAEGEGTGDSTVCTDAALGPQIPAKERCFCVLPGSSGAGSSAPLSSAEPQAGKLVLEWNCIHDCWKQALPTTASSYTSGFCASHDLFFPFPSIPVSDLAKVQCIKTNTFFLNSTIIANP